MKKEYKKPEIEVLTLAEDVILTSSFGGADSMQDNVTDNNFWGAN